eukprot:347955-Chlamydomonas_euryale.AAC.3
MTLDGYGVDKKALVVAEKSSCCPPCVLGKTLRAPFPASTSPSKESLQVMHTDLMGPISVASSGGARYIRTVLDGATGYNKVAAVQIRGQAATAKLDCMVQRARARKPPRHGSAL